MTLTHRTLDSTANSAYTERICNILKRTKNIVSNDKKYVKYMNNISSVKLPDLIMTINKTDASKHPLTSIGNQLDTITTNEKQIFIK